MAECSSSSSVLTILCHGMHVLPKNTGLLIATMATACNRKLLY